MKRVVVSVLVGAAFIGGGLAYAAMDTSTTEKAAQACYEHHEFGAEPVDVAKTSDGAEVLAQVSWGANDYGWCYLVLDRQATKVLRDHASGSLTYPTPTPEPTPSPAEQKIIDNYPDFYTCAIAGSRHCQHPPSEPTAEPTTPAVTKVSQHAAGYGQACLTTTGCSLDYFDVPTNQFLEVGEDIAPGKWNIAERFNPSCGVYRFNTAIDSHPFYGLGSGNRGSVGADYLHEFRPRFLIQQPSGDYLWHPAVIEEHDFFSGSVRWPEVATFTIEESDYMVVIKTGSGLVDRGC